MDFNPIGTCGGVGVGAGSTTTTTAALLVSGVGGMSVVDAGIFHRITMTSMTSAWYLGISNFEAIIVGLIILEIFVLRYLLILPLDLTKLIQQGILLQTVVSKKRRKRFLELFPSKQSTLLMETMLSVVKRLDTEECFLKALCELETLRNSKCSTPKLPQEIITSLELLKILDQSSKAHTDTPMLVLLLRAVQNGANNATSPCGQFYPKCTLPLEEMTDQLGQYFNLLNNN